MFVKIDFEIKPEAPPPPGGPCPVYYNQFAMCKTFTLLGFCIKYYFCLWINKCMKGSVMNQDLNFFL